MRRVQLDSSLLAAAIYHPQTRWLDVELRNGEQYRYFRVPVECFHHLLQAESKGRYFNYSIRNCFPFQHLTKASAPIALAADKN